MKQQKKLKTTRGRADVITSFMHGNEVFFLTATLTSMLGTVLNMATPQIIKVAVDSILGQRPFDLPGSVVGLLRLEQMRETPLRSLLLCAAAIVVVALLSGDAPLAAALRSRLDRKKCSNPCAAGYTNISSAFPFPGMCATRRGKSFSGVRPMWRLSAIL